MSQYGFDQKTESEKRAGGFIEPGIREPLEISNLELVQGGEGNPYFLVEVKDAEERTVHKRYYEPTLGGFVTNNEKLAKEIRKVNGVIANISRKFLGNNYNATGASFADVVGKVIVDIGDRYKGVKLRTKVVLNNKDFPTLPGYAPVFERLDQVTAEQSQLKIESRDKIVRSEEGKTTQGGGGNQGTTNVNAPWNQPPPND